MKDYVFTLRFPLKGVDDLDARMQALALVEDLGVTEEELKKAKLQEIFENKCPKAVILR